MIRPFHVGIKALIVQDGKVLLLRRRYGNTVWDFPGGRIDDDEDVHDTLRRELSEELPGIRGVTIHRLVGCKRMPKELPGGFGHLLLFYAVSAELPSPLSLSPEHASFEWVEPKEVADLIGAPFLALIQELGTQALP